MSQVGEQSCPSCGYSCGEPGSYCQKCGELIFAGLILEGFRFESCLGVGGMGSVYLALHTETKESVAVKVLHRELSQNPKVTKRFLNEARIVSELKHKNIVELKSYGEDKDVGPYMILEFLRGNTLDEVWSHSLSFPLSRSLSIVSQICEAAYHAHSQGLIHRDLKPSNIFLVEQDSGEDFVKLLDFGIAKFMDHRDQQKLTRTGTAVGTPLYMSPEQFSEKVEVDHRCDIFSLGIILFELLTGRLPFDSSSVIGLMFQRINEDAPLLSDVVPAFRGSVLERLLSSALERKTSNRLSSMRLFRQILDQVSEQMEPGSWTEPVKDSSSNFRGLPTSEAVLLAANGVLDDDELDDSFVGWDEVDSDYEVKELFDDFPDKHLNSSMSVEGISRETRGVELSSDVDFASGFWPEEPLHPEPTNSFLSGPVDLMSDHRARRTENFETRDQLRAEREISRSHLNNFSESSLLSDDELSNMKNWSHQERTLRSRETSAVSSFEALSKGELEATPKKAKQTAGCREGSIGSRAYTDPFSHPSSFRWSFVALVFTGIFVVGGGGGFWLYQNPQFFDSQGDSHSRQAKTKVLNQGAFLIKASTKKPKVRTMKLKAFVKKVEKKTPPLVKPRGFALQPISRRPLARIRRPLARIRRFYASKKVEKRKKAVVKAIKKPAFDSRIKKYLKPSPPLRAKSRRLQRITVAAAPSHIHSLKNGVRSILMHMKKKKPLGKKTKPLPARKAVVNALQKKSSRRTDGCPENTGKLLWKRVKTNERTLLIKVNGRAAKKIQTKIWCLPLSRVVNSIEISDAMGELALCSFSLSKAKARAHLRIWMRDAEDQSAGRYCLHK